MWNSFPQRRFVNWPPSWRGLRSIQTKMYHSDRLNVFTNWQNRPCNDPICLISEPLRWVHRRSIINPFSLAKVLRIQYFLVQTQTTTTHSLNEWLDASLQSRHLKKKKTSRRKKFPMIYSHNEQFCIFLRPLFFIVSLVFLAVSQERCQDNPKRQSSWVLWVTTKQLCYFIGYPETIKKKKQSLMGSAWFGLGDARGWQDSLLLHPVRLGTQDETEEILIWNSWSLSFRGWSSTPLVVQPRALALH